mgnify:FL=1
MDKIVYLLEDDKDIKELVSCALGMGGISVAAYETVAAFRVAKARPQVALLDVMLPDGNGLEVLEWLKETYPAVACIVLSALGSELDKVKGLNLGADDYIAKPFGVLELTARVNVALRKHRAPRPRTGLILDDERHAATLNGTPLELNNKEYQLLKYLAENEGRVLSRDAILNAVWGYDTGETRTLDNHIARLRKLGIPYIETVFGVGYVFKTE